MALQINRVINANVYADDLSLLGTAEEVEAPKLMQVMAEHKALGMVGKTEFPSGFDKMEMRIKWNAIYANVMAKFNNPYKAIRLQVRASLESWEGGDRVAQVPVVIYATVQSKGMPMGSFKPNDNVEIESNLSCTHVKMEIDGIEIVEFDASANIFKINGVDQLVDYRNNIGA